MYASSVCERKIHSKRVKCLNFLMATNRHLLNYKIKNHRGTAFSVPTGDNKTNH